MDSFLLIFLLVIAYTTFLITLKFFEFGKKKTCDNCLNCCPDCQHAMERIKRRKSDYLLNHCTFHIFNYKRYRCIECGWEGLKWEKKVRPGDS